MRGRITQGKRNDADKESTVLAAVHGDVHLCGSVHGAKKRVGKKLAGHQNAAGKIVSNPGKNREKVSSPSDCAAEEVVVENNALGLALKGCGIAAPCRSLIAKQVLEFGVKAGITGIVAKEIADKISEDDLDHFVMLTMMAGKISLNRFFSLRHFVAS